MLFTVSLTPWRKKVKTVNDVMKKYFNKELPMANENNEDFENSNNVGFVIMSMLRAKLNVVALDIETVVSRLI